MPSQAVSSHGVLLAVELAPGASPGVFTTVAELNTDITMSFMRNVTESSPHNYSIDSHVPGILRRDPVSGTVNYIFGNTVHDGLRDHLVANTQFGMRWTYPNATGVYIASGHMTAWKRTNAVRDGIDTAEITMQLSGPMILDGEEIGT